MATLHPLDIQEHLTRGLRDDRRMPRNAPVLEVCHGAKPTQYGLARPESIIWPCKTALSEIAGSWPYPQLIRGKVHTLLATETAIYEVDETPEDGWKLTEIPIYRLGAPSGQLVQNGTFTDNADGWTLGDGWAYADNRVKHTSGIAPLSQEVLTPTNLYRIQFTVIGMTKGSLTPALGTQTGTPVTQDGTYSEDIVSIGSGTLSLVPSTDFDGAVDDVAAYTITIGTIPKGTGPWHFADFQDVWFLSNGACLVSRLQLYNRWTTWVWQNADGSYPIVPKTVANFRNRLLLAGMAANTARFQAAAWEDLWQTWIEHSPADIMTYQDLAMGPNVVMYSDLGGGDFYWPFAAELAMFGMPGTAEEAAMKPLYIDRIKTGRIGFIPMPWQGSVQSIRSLGGAAVVYGSNGVSAVAPQAEEGLAVFRAVPVADVGVAGRGAAGGDDRQHAFVDNTGTLWAVDGNMQARREGYNEFVSVLDQDDLVVAWDPDQWDVHISDGTAGYIKSRTGLGRAKVFPTHLNYTEQGLVGAYAPVAGTDDTFEAITGTFDMGLRGIKTIKNVEVAATDVTDLRVYVEYKHDRSTAFTRSLGLLVSNEGFAFPIVSGTDFRLRLTGKWGSNGKIDYVTIRWTLDDKRSARGALGALYKG